MSPACFCASHAKWLLGPFPCPGRPGDHLGLSPVGQAACWTGLGCAVLPEPSLGLPEPCRAEIVTSSFEKGWGSLDERSQDPVLWVCAELWLPGCCIPALLPSHSCLFEPCPSEALSFQQVCASISLLNCLFYTMGLFHTYPPTPRSLSLGLSLWLTLSLLLRYRWA